MPKGASNVKLIEPPLAEPHERWCERSEIPQSEEFPPTRFLKKNYNYLRPKKPKFKLKATVIGVFPEKNTDISYGSKHRANGPSNPDIMEAEGSF